MRRMGSKDAARSALWCERRNWVLVRRWLRRIGWHAVFTVHTFSLIPQRLKPGRRELRTVTTAPPPDPARPFSTGKNPGSVFVCSYPRLARSGEVWRGVNTHDLEAATRLVVPRVSCSPSKSDVHPVGVRNPGTPIHRRRSFLPAGLASIPHQPRRPHPPRLHHVQPTRTGLTWRLLAMW